MDGGGEEGGEERGGGIGRGWFWEGGRVWGGGKEREMERGGEKWTYSGGMK